MFWSALGFRFVFFGLGFFFGLLLVFDGFCLEKFPLLGLLFGYFGLELLFDKLFLALGFFLGFPLFSFGLGFFLRFFLWHWTFFLALDFCLDLFLALEFCLDFLFALNFSLDFLFGLGLFLGLLEVGLDFCLGFFWGWIFSWTFWLMFQWTINSFPVTVKISCLIRWFWIINLENITYFPKVMLLKRCG